MKKIILSSAISIGLLTGMAQAASACVLHTALLPYCAVKCEIDGGAWWQIEECYIGSKPPLPDNQ